MISTGAAIDILSEPITIDENGKAHISSICLEMLW